MLIKNIFYFHYAFICIELTTFLAAKVIFDSIQIYLWHFYSKYFSKAV